jgi:hypothetical protein
MLSSSIGSASDSTDEVQAMAADPASAGQEQFFQASQPLLHGFSPREVASLIRGIDSQLVSIEYAKNVDERALVYTFEVAGKRQPFCIAVPSTPILSIADLYPEAAPQERELQRRFGLVFEPPSAEAEVS